MKKLFKHNEKLDEQVIVLPLEDVKIDETFYPANKEELLLETPKEQRLSQYFLPNENISDDSLFQVLYRLVNKTARYIALRAVNISLVEVEGENYASFEGDKIHLSLSPLCDHRIPFYMRVNTMIAIGFHEMFHVRYTTPELSAFLFEKGITKEKINKLGKKIKVADCDRLNLILKNKLHRFLFNIVEDKRIESKGLKEFQGYVFYFDESRKYILWQFLNSMRAPKPTLVATGEEPTEEQMQTNNLIRYIMIKVLMPEALEDFEKIRPTDKVFEDLMKKVDEIIILPNTTVKEALLQSDFLLELFPKEMQEQEPEKGDITGEMLAELSEMVGDMLEEMMAAENQEQTTKKEPISKILTVDANSRLNDITIFPGKEEAFDSKLFDEAKKIAANISKNLSFLDSRFNRVSEMFELNSGEIDNDELYSLNFNKNVFQDEEEAPGYNLDFGVLIDESGSMGGNNKIKKAQLAALSIAIALNNNPYINLFIYGHTADEGSWRSEPSRNYSPTSMYRYLDPIEKSTNINTLFSVQARSNNADGYAIAKMGDILKKGKAKQKVLVVISDGQPSASGYGSTSAFQHIWEVNRRLESMGVYVIQICVDNIEDSDKMFKNFIPYEEGSLALNLRKVLMKKLVEVSNMV